MDFSQLLVSAKKVYQNMFRGAEGEVLVKSYTGPDTKVATFAYIPLVSLIILVFRKNNSEFVSFHAKEAAALLLIAFFILLLLPIFLKVVALVILYGIFIFAAYKASKGEKLYLPLVNEIANSIEI